MGEYEFTYDLPVNLVHGFSRFLELNGKESLARLIKGCKLSYQDLGLAYYAGMRGDTWNKKALDFTLEGTESAIKGIKPFKNVLIDMLEKYIKPSVSGYLVRDIAYNISDPETEIVLPDESDNDFRMLSRDIQDALAKDEPVLVLDRLHTYSMKYFRVVCRKYNIPIYSGGGELYPLHSLVGGLAKYYEQNGIFTSGFAKRAMKMSISLFDSYNEIRNNKSFAHDNDLLDKREATYVVKILADTLSFIDEIENKEF